MSIIYTYPTITGNINDNVLVSDSTNNNSTSQVSISRIKDLIDVVDTLNGLTGSVSIIPGNFMAVTTSGNDISISAEVGGSGTASTIPKWSSDGSTLTDSFIVTTGNNMSIPGYIARTGFPDTYFGYESTGNSKNIALVSNGTQTVRSISDGTNSYGWLGYNGVTSLYATDTGAQLQGAYFDIPNYIRHVGDYDSLFGFTNNDDFIINVNSGTDQIRVRQNSIIISTDTGTKFAAGPSGVTLYNDENGSTTTSKIALSTYDSGINVLGGTENSFTRGGAVRFYNSANTRYVGISGPTTTGTNYEIILPDTIGAVGQVLAIASINGSNAVMQWADNGSVDPNALKVDSMVPYGETASKNDGAVSITVSGGTPDYDVQIQNSVSGVSFLINGSNNQTVFNFGTQAGGSSSTNLTPGTWKVLGGDSSNPQKLFEPLNKTFVIAEVSCNITTSSTPTPTSGPGADDGSVSIAIFDGTPNYNVTITHTDGTVLSVVGATSSPVSFDDELKPGTWTITGTDNEPSGAEKCPITGSFVITEDGSGSFFADGAAPEADSGTPTADSD